MIYLLEKNKKLLFIKYLMNVNKEDKIYEKKKMKYSNKN